MKSRRLEFYGDGIKGMDVYNTSAPFIWNGQLHIAARVEPRESEESIACFFYHKKGIFYRDTKAEELKLQDPFLVRGGRYFMIGGVETFYENGKLKWKTCFYEGDGPGNLEKVAEGPIGMKDIRPVKVGERVLILTRPQGGCFERGRICFRDGRGELPYVLNHVDLKDALLVELPIGDGAWVGANDVYLLRGRLGVLGHIGEFADGKGGAKRYRAMTFEIPIQNHWRNWRNMQHENYRIIAERRHFAFGPSKRKGLEDIVFPGGMNLDGRMAVLYAGVSDCESHEKIILNPFL